MFTTEEETTMNGAKNVDENLLEGKSLLSLDHIREGELLVSCAGIVKLNMTLPIEKTNILEKYKSFKIKITGLLGGHSGNDIHVRANSNMLMGRLLNEISNNIELYIYNMVGGLKANAIPRENETIIFIDSNDKEKLRDICSEYNLIFKNELKDFDKEIEVVLDEVNITENVQVLDNESTQNLIAILNIIPNGIQTMSRRIIDLPESSLNVGVINIIDNIVKIDITMRSSVKSLEEAILNKLKQLSLIFNMTIEIEAVSPLLAFKEKSKLRDLCIDIYKKLYGREPEQKSFHAIVEGGVFSSKIKDLDMLLISPNLYDIHSPNERLSISSTQKIWKYVLEVLKEFGK